MNLENLEMKIIIETTFRPAAIKCYLDEHNLKLPVFFNEENTHIVILPSIRHRVATVEFINWLMSW
jgi:hypothetical protein